MRKILGILFVVGMFSQVSSAGFIDDVQSSHGQNIGASLSEVKVIKTVLRFDSAVELPNGIIQVINPYVNIGGRNYKLADRVYKSDRNTATIACAMLNKTYVSHKTDGHSGAEHSISFNSVGGMDVYSSFEYIKILTCQ